MRKRALGKGIEALIPGHDDRPLHEGYRLVRVEDIRPNPHQPRVKISEDDIPPDADDCEEVYDPETGDTIIRYYVFDRSGWRKIFLPVPKLTKPDKPIWGATSKIEIKNGKLR